MAGAIKTFLNVLAAPTEAFEGLKRQPRWGLAALIICGVAIGVSILMSPLAERAALAAMPSGLDENGLSAAMAMAQRLRLVAIAVVPLVYLIRWLFVGAFLYFLSLLGGVASARFRQVFAVVTHAEVILLLMNVVNVLILLARGAGAIHHPLDLQAIVGCDFFLSDKFSNPTLFLLLNSINVFSLWYVATLGIGLSVVTGLSKLRATLSVALVWFLGVGFQIAMSLVSTARGAGTG